MKKLIILFGFLFISSPLFAAKYEIDTGHSSVGFKVRHLVSKVPGKFDEFKGTIDFDPKNVEASKVMAEIKTRSVDTSNKKRDDHLKSADFFDVKKYPTMKYTSKKVSDVESDSFELEGDLTLHGVTKPVKLKVEIGGQGVDPWGNKKAGFTARAKINRKDFGIIWNKTLDAGGVMLGDDVEITIEIEANQKG